MKFKTRKAYKLFLILIFALISYVILNPIILKSSYANIAKKEIYVTAHRGSSLYYPENTLKSIEVAINENADYVEIDVRTTKDNEVVLFHDSNLKKIDGSNRSIKDMTLEEVKTVDNGYYKNEIFKDEKIPTLEEVFTIFKGKTKFNIELKVIDKEDILPNQVSELIKKYNMNSDVVVSCFDKDIIKQYKVNNPNTKTGLITSNKVKDINDISSDFISLKYNLLTETLVHELHDCNKEIHVWTVNDKEKIINAINLGVDNIITDNASLVIEILNCKSLSIRD
ncbi:MAG: glycerophosphodiester phosphodiesterase family protein [Terrisporobacter sp.]|uniref:glycerophosphodiester phosphodiesterase n=1 Tax=Terrisporobacter sp. TaxID=1965305 RepID=UPI002FCA6C5F